MNPRDRLFVALDLPDPSRALDLARALRGRIGGVKVGLELFGSAGPEIVRQLRALGIEVFLDLKLHDIPNTVARAAAAAARLDVRFLTVHALGGIEMVRRGVESARDEAARSGARAPTVLAVTVLTSHDDGQLARIGIAGPCAEAVVRLAGLARRAGAAGVVCSALEISLVRGAFGSGEVVVPGIRPAGHARDDQSRTATPAEAVRAGADRIVVGRPITTAADPAAAADAIVRDLA